MRIITEYPDYAVTESGEIYSLYTLNRFGKHLRDKPFRLIQNECNSGYLTVFLGSQKFKTAKRLLVHRLVALCFITNPENKPVVNHKDGNKRNNTVANLEWATRSENEIHAHIKGLKNFKKDRNPARKMSEEKASQARDLWSNGISQRKIASRFGVSQSCIWHILANKTW